MRSTGNAAEKVWIREDKELESGLEAVCKNKKKWENRTWKTDKKYIDRKSSFKWAREVCGFMRKTSDCGVEVRLFEDKKKCGMVEEEICVLCSVEDVKCFVLESGV